MQTNNFQMFRLDLEKNAEEQEIKLQLPLDHRKSKRIPEKHLLLLHWLCLNLWLCGSQQTVENSERDENSRPPDLSLEKSICGSGSFKTEHWTADWFKIGKGVYRGCVLSFCLFNLYVEDIMQNAGLNEAQLKSRFLGEVSITSNMQMPPLLW